MGPTPIADALPRPLAPPSPGAASTSPEAERRLRAAVQAWRDAGWYPRHRDRLSEAASGVAPADLAAQRALFARIPGPILTSAERALRQRGGSLILTGPRGTGKTQLACWLSLVHAVETKSDRYTQAYRVWTDLPDSIRQLAREGTGSDQAYALRGTTLLVLDEVQEDLGTPTARGAFTRLIDYRNGHYLSTVVIANLPLDELEKTLGASAFSRMNETGVVVDCKWEAYR